MSSKLNTMLDDVRCIEDPLLRAETADEIIKEAHQVRDQAICEAARVMSIRQISTKLGIGKSTIHEIVRAGSE